MALPKRKPFRLATYDYSRNGAYFITICTYKRRELLSHITVGQGLAPAENKLTVYGMIAEQQLIRLADRYPMAKIDKYVIMPNHIHILLSINAQAAGASPCPTLSDMVCTFKSLTVKDCKRVKPIETLFQTSFYDHIVRDETDYQTIWEYIQNNPAKWSEDRFYVP